MTQSSSFAMTQYYFLVASYSTAENGGNGPLVVELGAQISGTSYYELTLAPLGVLNSNQLWALSDSNGQTTFTSVANPKLQIGFNPAQLDDYSYQAIAYAPQSGDQNVVWTIQAANPDSASVVLYNPAAQKIGGWDYVLSAWNNYESSVSPGATCILYPPGASNPAQVPQAGYFTVEQIPSWVTIQTQAPDASGVSGNFVIGFADGAVQAGSQPTTQPFQEGQLDQLWTFWYDGTIRSAANPSLAITAPSQSGNSVTMQAVGDAPLSTQVWESLNGTLVSQANTGLALNVCGGTAAPGTAIITYAASSKDDNELWTITGYNPAPSGQYFVIANGGSASPMILTVAAGLSLAAVARSGNASLAVPPGQLWQLSLDGNIVSALSPSIGLAAVVEDQNGQKSYSLAVEQLQSGAQLQKWAWLPGSTQTVAVGGAQVQAGMLVNLGLMSADGGQYLAIQNQAGALAQACLQPFTYKDRPSAAQDLWCMQPAGPSYDTPTMIRSRCPIEVNGKSAEIELALTVTGSYSKDLPANDSGPYDLSESVVVGFKQGDGSAWQMTVDGYIVSSINPDLVLSLAVDPASTLQAPAYSTNVVISFKAPLPYAGQLWTATAEGIIYSRHNGMVLTMNGTFDPNTGTPVPVIVAPLANPAPPSQIWDYGTGKGLQNVLVQPSQPFPYPPADRSTYGYVDAQLGLKDVTLRRQYLNLAAPLASYQAALTVMSSNGSSDWSTIVAQLNKELTAAIAVQALFQQLADLHVNIGLQQVMTLNELASFMAIPASTTIPHKKHRSWIWSLVNGVVYTAIGIAGTVVGDPGADAEYAGLRKLIGSKVAPAIANLWQTGMSTAQTGFGARASGNSQSAVAQKVLQNVQNYETTVAGLEQALLAAFEMTGAALAQIEMAILGDWGKLSQVYQMICQPIGTSSLFWSGRVGTLETRQLLKSYTVQLLQALMPLQSKTYGITADYLHGPISQPLQLGLQADGKTFICLTRDGRQNKFVAGGNSDLLSILWANIDRPYDYFNGLNGWSLPATYNGQWGSSSVAGIVVEIFNQTPQPMTLYLDWGSSIVLGYDASNYYRPVQPFGSQSFAFDAAYVPLSFYLMPFSYLDNPGSNSSAGNLVEFTYSINKSNTEYQISDQPNLPGYAVLSSLNNDSASYAAVWTIIISQAP